MLGLVQTAQQQQAHHSANSNFLVDKNKAREVKFSGFFIAVNTACLVESHASHYLISQKQVF
jgi:hypothetical protein